MEFYNETPCQNNRIISMLPSSQEAGSTRRTPMPNPITSAIHSGFNRYSSVNPWDLRRYQEQQIQNSIRFNETQTDINRWIYRSALAYTGHNEYEFDVDVLIPECQQQYSSYDDYVQKTQERIEQNKVTVAVNSPQIYSNERIRAFNHWVENERQNTQRYKGKTKEEIYKEMDQIYLESTEYQEERNRRNFSNRYSKADFRRYLNSTQGNTSWTTVNSIDDLEVQIPTGITSDYARHRARFFERLNNNRRV